MAPDHMAGACPAQLGGQHIILVALHQQMGAHAPRQGRPADADPRIIEMKKKRISADQSSGKKAAMAMNSGMAGTVRMASVTIWMAPSSQPPK